MCENLKRVVGGIPGGGSLLPGHSPSTRQALKHRSSTTQALPKPHPSLTPHRSSFWSSRAPFLQLRCRFLMVYCSSSEFQQMLHRFFEEIASFSDPPDLDFCNTFPCILWFFNFSANRFQDAFRAPWGLLGDSLGIP